MGKVIAALAILVAALAGGAVYGWGAGAFRPCETIGRLFAGDRCTQILDLPDRSLGGVAMLANGNLLAAASAPAGEPTGSAKLIEISPRGGAPIGETVLPANQVETQLTDLAVSADGNLVALAQSFREGRRRYGLQVFDRNGKLVSDIGRGLPGYMAFDSQDRLMIHPGGLGYGVPTAAGVEAFALDAPETPITPDPADTLKLFEHGLNAAISPDGRIFALLMDHLGSQPFVGLRVGQVGQESEPGQLFATSLRADCGYVMSDIAFSAGKLAAEFDCPERWGQTSSALVVWDYVDGNMLLTLPTIDGFSDLLWLNETTLVASRYNYGNEHHELFRITVPEPKRR